MTRSRIINIIAMVFNTAIIALFCLGFYFHFFYGKNVNELFASGEFFKNLSITLTNFGFITAFICFISSIFMMFALPSSIIRRKNVTSKVFIYFRHVSAFLCAVCLFVNLTVLTPAFSFKETFITGNVEYKELLFTNAAPIFRLALPIISLLLFLFLEIETKPHYPIVLLPFSLILIYGIIMISIVSYMSKVDISTASKFAPYFFFLLNDDLIKSSLFASTLTSTRTISILVVNTLLCFFIISLFWVFNRFNGAMIVGYEYVEVTKKVENKPATKKIVKKTNKKNNHKKKEVVVPLDHVYHVSLYSRKLRNWKVKLAKGKRSIKIFPTQEEAIEYAKQLVENNGGAIHVHSMFGKFRED